MSIRKLKRNMARAQLREEGFTRINKKSKKTPDKLTHSAFAINWRDAFNRRAKKKYKRRSAKNG